MSGSETEVINGREPFSVGLQKSSLHSQSVVPNMCLAFSGDGTAVFKTVAPTSPSYQSPGTGFGGVDGSTGGTLVSHGLNMIMASDSTKRKRGRPRKYGPDGTISLALGSAPTSATQSSAGFSSSPTDPPASGGLSSPNSAKKARGRPPGSRKKQQLEALGLAGIGFTPHVITIKAGEDVSSKIMSFSQNGPRTVCILSANGAISNVTIRQPATFGGTVTYEGRYEILSLSGSFILAEKGGQRSRTGGLSVSLCGPDGRVLGGSVAGLLTAASPVQVVVGSFIADGRKESKSAQQTGQPRMESIDGIDGYGSGDPTGPGSPQSGGTFSESAGSPLYQSSGAFQNSNLHGMPNTSWK